MNDYTLITEVVKSIPALRKLENPREDVFWQHYPYLNIYDWSVSGGGDDPSGGGDDNPPSGGGDDNPPTPVLKYVQDLIDENYATTVTGNGGTYVEILSTCPYALNQIVDIEDVALNNKKLVEGTNNVIVWDQALPEGWDCDSIYDMYNGKTMNFAPRARMFWGLTCIPNSFEITFPSAAWSVNDYPWGNGGSNDGVFAPRFNLTREQEYADKQFRATPRNVTVNFPYHYSSVAQTMFAQMEQTVTFNLNCATDDIWNNFWECHDVTGMFERCYRLQTLNITGAFSWAAISTCHNMFRQCNDLTSIPYSSVFGSREHAQNILYPRFNGTRGSAECAGLFNATSLEYIGPVLNMNAISLNGCTVDGYNQSALGSSYSQNEQAGALLFNCPELTDVRIINIGNNSWNFTNTSTKTYAPKIDADSINYLLNHVKDETGNNYSLTFSTLHQAEVSSAAIEYAESKGWTINFV